MKRLRVLLGDDHVLLLEGVRTLLEGDFDIVGAFENGRDLLEAALTLQPDAILLDITMPQLNDIDATRQLRKLVPQSKIIIVTMHADPEYVHEAFRAGASAYVLKQSAVSELVTAIETVFQGSTYITPLITGESLQKLRKTVGHSSTSGSLLTSRQREVLQLVAEGRTSKEIASILQISMKTVEFHKSRIMKELGMHSVAEVTRYAMRTGIVGQ
jgi:DNA-binding NarL/FixJ family response regulator